MSQLTCDRNTPERQAQLRAVIAAAPIFAGSLVAVNADGKAVPAAAAANLRVIGRAEHAAETGGGVTVASGCFAWEGTGFTAGSVGKTAYVVDEETVTLTAGAHPVVAGVVYEVDAEGVWVLTAPGNCGEYAARPVPAAAIADVTEAGADSANLITALNAALAVLRTNGMIAANA